MGEGVSALLADYDRELAERLAAASRGIAAGQVASCPPAEAAAALDAADRDLREAADLLTSMALEAAGQGGAPRARVDARKAETARVRADLRATRVALAAARGDRDRAELLDGAAARLDLEAGGGIGGGIGAEDDTDDDPRAKLLSESRRLHEGSSERILESRRNIAQTESIGASILQDLQNQRATILRARDNLGGVDEGLNQSSNVISTMNRRAFFNKLILYAVGLVFALIILGMVGRKLFLPHETTA